MTARRFFVNSTDINFPSAQLKGSEHHHLRHVLRKRPGEKIIVFDEEGRIYQAEIVDIRKNRTTLRLLSRESPPSREVVINLGLGLLKAKNMDLVIQKATEWGVARIFPLLTARSVVKMSHQEKKKINRWQQIAVEAAKQSGQVLLPQIELPLSLNQFVEECSETEKFLLSESGGEILWQVLEKLDKTFIPSSPQKGVTLAIGPEGGWTEEEQNYMINHGFRAVSLGPYVLRAETAALSGIAIIAHFFMRKS